jgi:hypothetical protein
MGLDKLIEAVEAGDDDAVNTITFGMSSAAKNKGECFPAHEMLLAYFHDSLDAAKDVHDALLPGWAWNIDAGDGAYVENRGDFGVPCPADIPGMPARAWLLAILKAKQAEGRG